MEVIKKGLLNVNWYGQCKKCKAVIKADENELTSIENGGFRGDYESFSHEDCIFCKSPKSVTFYKEGTKDAQRVHDMAFTN